MTGSFNELAEQIFAKLRQTPLPEREEKFRSTIFDFLPGNVDDLYDVVRDADWTGMTVEAYGVSVWDVLKWAFVQAMEDQIDIIAADQLDSMMEDLHDAGYDLVYVNNYQFLSIKDQEDKSIFYGPGSGPKHNQFIEMVWNNLINGETSDAE